MLVSRVDIVECGKCGDASGTYELVVCGVVVVGCCWLLEVCGGLSMVVVEVGVAVAIVTF